MRTYVNNICEAVERQNRSDEVAWAKIWKDIHAGKTRPFHPPTLLPEQTLNPYIELYNDASRFFSYKANRWIKFETKLERDLLTLLEWDYSVDGLEFQIPALRFSRAGERFRIKPNVATVPSRVGSRPIPNHEKAVYLFDHYEHLEVDWDYLQPQFDYAESYFAKRGLRFRVLTEKNVNPVFVENAKFLLQFRGPRYQMPATAPIGYIRAVREALSKMPSTFTPRQLLDMVAKTYVQTDSHYLIPWIWNLYADYFVQCDMLTPMTMDTPSWRSHALGIAFPSKRPDWRKTKNEWRP